MSEPEKKANEVELPPETPTPEGFQPLVGFEDEPEPAKADEPGEQPSGEEPPAGEQNVGEPGNEEDDKKEKEPKSFGFELEGDKKQPEPSKPNEEELTEIVHNGQVYKLTKAQMVALAQKGFDYDRKLGPHKKLVQLIEADPGVSKVVQLIEADPGVSKVVNDYIQGKINEPQEQAKFKPLPLTDYDSEEEWLQANLSKAMNELAPKIATDEKPAATKTDPAEFIAEALFNRDPDHFDQVAPHLDEYAKRYLTVTQYAHINNPRNRKDLFRFYDKVKEHLLQQNTPTPPRKEEERPRFSLQPGGGEAPRKPDKTNVAWELPNDEFQKVLDKARGY